MANPYALDFSPIANALAGYQRAELDWAQQKNADKRLAMDEERLGFERARQPLHLEGLRLGNVSAQQGITREEKALPLDLQAKKVTIAGQGLQNQAAAQGIEAKKRELEKGLYGDMAALGQMIESDPNPDSQRQKLQKIYQADPRIRSALAGKLPQEILDDPVAVARYARAVYAGYQAPQTMNLGPDHTLVTVSRDPNDPYAPPTARPVFKTDAKHDVPAGYEKDPTKPGGLRPIAGGPADKITGEQAARTALIVGGVANMPKIRSIFLGTQATPTEAGKDSALGGNINPLSYARHYSGVGDVGEGQRLMASGMEGVLRALTGAAATKEEVQREVTKYLPQPSDSQETRTRKLDLFENNLRLIANLTAHGTSGTDVLKALQTGTLDTMKVQGRVPQQGASTAGVPKVGELRKGHVFLGGDPASEASWAKVQQ